MSILTRTRGDEGRPWVGNPPTAAGTRAVGGGVLIPEGGAASLPLRDAGSTQNSSWSPVQVDVAAPVASSPPTVGTLGPVGDHRFHESGEKKALKDSGSARLWSLRMSPSVVGVVGEGGAATWSSR